jgi:hypothetical protein
VELIKPLDKFYWSIGLDSRLLKVKKTDADMATGYFPRTQSINLGKKPGFPFPFLLYATIFPCSLVFIKKKDYSMQHNMYVIFFNVIFILYLQYSCTGLPFVKENAMLLFSLRLVLFRYSAFIICWRVMCVRNHFFSNMIWLRTVFLCFL